MKLKWAFNSATVMKLDWAAELKLLQQFKWKAFEPWYDKVKACLDAGATAGQLRRQMADAGLTPIGLAPGILWTPSEGIDRNKEADDLAQRLDVTAAIGAPALTVVLLGKVNDLAAEYDGLIDPLRRAAEAAAQRGLKINLEFLGKLSINGTMGSCIQLINRVDHPALGMLLDLCHYYVGASHLEELSLLKKGRLFLVHVDDAKKMPMETLTNEQRCFPGQGRINVPDLLNRIRKITSYDGYFSIELYDPEIWTHDPLQVMREAALSVDYVEQQPEN